MSPGAPIPGEVGFLTDENGTFDLTHVHSVTPETIDHNPKAGTRRIVGVLHHQSGHSFRTNTDYGVVREMVFGK